MEEKPSKTIKSPRFPHTRELIQLALKEGMTQGEIARKCRVQQSVVSAWASGKRKATEQQIEPLLKRYGARLHRGVTRLYLVPKTPFEESDIAKQLLALTERFDQAEFEKLELQIFGKKQGPAGEWQARYNAVTEEARLQQAFQGPHRLVQVQGRVLFRYTFRELRARVVRRESYACAGFPVARWLLHAHPTDRERLVLVRQERRPLSSPALQRIAAAATQALSEQLGHQDRDGWVVHLEDDSSNYRHVQGRETVRKMLYRYSISPWIESPEDAGRWVSFIERPMKAAELMDFARTWLADPEEAHNPHDEAVLPFLLARALVELGLDVPGVERYTPPE